MRLTAPVALIALLLLAGCAGRVASREPLVLYPTVDDRVRARAVAERARDAEVVYLGEVHDNPHHHAAQARILEAILAAGARPAVAFEMLAEGQQPAADAVLAGAGTPAEADRRLRWGARGWPDFAMYWPLFDLARRHGLPVLATDLDAAVVRRIAREGLETLGDDRVRLVSLLPSDPAREQAIARTIQTAHCDLLPAARLPRMVESWHARNVTIARRLADALRGGTPVSQVVVIIGRGHQAEGGVPAQLEALRPGTRQLVVEILEVPTGERAEAVARRGIGDIVWLTPPVDRPDPCAELRQRLGNTRLDGSAPGNQADARHCSPA